MSKFLKLGHMRFLSIAQIWTLPERFVIVKEENITLNCVLVYFESARAFFVHEMINSEFKQVEAFSSWLELVDYCERKLG